MTADFSIKIVELNWQKGLKEQLDLCAHGRVLVQIGAETLADATDEWTLSSTALFLMRTVETTYNVGDFAGQLLPCCGHGFIASQDEQSVSIMGCPTGIDWTIQHLDNNRVKHSTPNGAEALISKATYRQQVLAFAQQIEQFYQTSKPKIIPEDAFDRAGYAAFWTEWRALKTALITADE